MTKPLLSNIQKKDARLTITPGGHPLNNTDRVGFKALLAKNLLYRHMNVKAEDFNAMVDIADASVGDVAE